MSDKRKELIAEIKAELSDLTDEQIIGLFRRLSPKQRNEIIKEAKNRLSLLKQDSAKEAI